MWANAQRDGRPAEYTWRPLFNAAKFVTPARHTKSFSDYYFNYFRHVAMLQKFAGSPVGAPFMWGPLFGRTC